jgi:hypothetical protein
MLRAKFAYDVPLRSREIHIRRHLRTLLQIDDVRHVARVHHANVGLRLEFNTFPMHVEASR